MPSGKREGAQWNLLSGLAAAQPEEIRQRRAASEATLSAIRGRLGAPGTYDLPDQTAPAAGPAYTAPSGAMTADPLAQQQAAAYLATLPKGKTTTLRAKQMQTLGTKQEAGVMDISNIEARNVASWLDPRYNRDVGTLGKVRQLSPERYTQQLEQSAEFRIASRMTAQAEQLLARKGPLWDDLIKNQQLPIIEGASAMAKESAENLRRAAAKGGAARRDAFETIQRMNVQREINTQRMQTIANMRVELDKFAIDNAQKQLTFNQGWAENLAGIRESYNSAMDNASALMATASLPVMYASLEKAQQWRGYAHAKKRAKLGSWITGAIGLAQIGIGAKMSSPEIMSGGFGALGSAVSGPEAPSGY